MNRRLFFGSILGVGAASSLQLDAEQKPEPIQQGDVLVLEHPGYISDDAHRYISKHVEAAVPGVKVLILEEGMKVKLLRPQPGEVIAPIDGRALADEVIRHIPAALQRHGL